MIREIFDEFRNLRYHDILKFAIVIGILTGVALLPFDRKTGGLIFGVSLFTAVGSAAASAIDP